MSVNSSSSSSSSTTSPDEGSNESFRNVEEIVFVVQTDALKPVQPPKPKIKLSSWKFTSRQKQRIIFLPIMVVLLVAASLLSALFEAKCAQTIQTATKIDENILTFYCMRVCYGGALLYLFIACCCSFPVKKPSEIWAFNFTFGVVFIWFISVFVGNHYHSELSRLQTHRFSPVRQESFDRILKRVYHGQGSFSTVKAKSGKNETETRPIPSRLYFKTLNNWLDKVQSSMECCGIEGFGDYNIDMTRAFDNSSGVMALLPTMDSQNKPIHFGLKEKHVLDKLDPDDGEVPDVRESCCKDKKKKCNFNIFNTIPANTTNIHTEGCREIISNSFKECHTWFWMIANMPMFIGLPAMFVAFCYTRHAQGLSFKACKSLRRIRDPELEDEEPKSKSKPKPKEGKDDKEKKKSDGKDDKDKKKSDGKVAPAETESKAAVYNVIEHIQPGHVRKSHEFKSLPLNKKTK